MDEGRRFIRYLIPGSLCLLETSLFLLGIMPGWTMEALKSLGETGSGVAAAFGGFLASGALGFLLSTFHHVWFWRREHLDYRPFFQRLVGNGLVELDPVPDSAQDAWITLNRFWHVRMATSQLVNGANDRANSFSNLVHSLGAARMGFWVAVAASGITALFVSHGNQSDSGWDRLAFGLTVVVIVFLGTVHMQAYFRTLEQSRDFTQQVLEEAIVHDDNQAIVDPEGH